MERTTDEFTVEDGNGGLLDYTITNGILPEDLVVMWSSGVAYERIHGETPETNVGREVIEYLVHGV